MPGEGYMLPFPGDEGSGPQDGSEPRFLIIGQIVGAAGLKGAVKVDVMTDFPERFESLKSIYLGDELALTQIVRAELRKNGRQIVLQLEGCENRTQAEGLRGKLLQIPAEEAVPLEEGLYYVHQVLGLNVETESGESLGVLSEVLFTGSNDVYVVTGEGRELLIPVLEEVIREVDLDRRKIIVRLPEGLV